MSKKKQWASIINFISPQNIFIFPILQPFIPDFNSSLSKELLLFCFLANQITM